MGRPRGEYTRAERVSDAVVHGAGLLIALMAAPVLVTLAALRVRDAALVAAATVYGATLVGMLAASAAYHLTPAPAWRDRLRRLDQSAIYLKIAGAYTPFAAMAGAEAMPFLAGLWAAALAGVGMKLLTARALFGLTLALYLAMGWAALAFGGPIFARMTPGGFHLVLAGGALYTVGVAFLMWESLPFHVTIWHVFVLTASITIYAAMVIELGGVAAA